MGTVGDRQQPDQQVHDRNCTLFDTAGDNVLAISSPGLSASPTDQPEAACIPDRGSEIFLSLTMRPTS